VIDLPRIPQDVQSLCSRRLDERGKSQLRSFRWYGTAAFDIRRASLSHTSIYTDIPFVPIHFIQPNNSRLDRHWSTVASILPRPDRFANGWIYSHPQCRQPTDDYNRVVKTSHHRDSRDIVEETDLAMAGSVGGQKVRRSSSARRAGLTRILSVIVR
jgi:hypothetical protein